MRPLISEFSYGYALTEELASGAFGPLAGAPIFPSLIQEGQLGYGYDLRLPYLGAPLYLQFKLSDCMVYASAAEWNLFGHSYFRMHLRPGRHSRQHEFLHARDIAGDEVYYVAPYFHESPQLDRFYRTATVATNSVWFRPVDIGLLPDNDDHCVAFDSSPNPGYFCSRDPKKLERSFKKDEFVKTEIE